MLDKNQWLAIGLVSGFAYILGKDKKSFEAEIFESQGNLKFSNREIIQLLFNKNWKCPNCDNIIKNKQNIPFSEEEQNDITWAMLAKEYDLTNYDDINVVRKKPRGSKGNLARIDGELNFDNLLLLCHSCNEKRFKERKETVSFRTSKEKKEWLEHLAKDKDIGMAELMNDIVDDVRYYNEVESFEAKEFFRCKNCDYNVELEVEAVFEDGLCSNCLVKEGFQKEYGTHGKWMKNGEYAKKIKGATYEDYDAESFQAEIMGSVGDIENHSVDKYKTKHFLTDKELSDFLIKHGTNHDSIRKNKKAKGNIIISTPEGGWISEAKFSLSQPDNENDKDILMIIPDDYLGIHQDAESFEAEKINTFSEIENEWKDSSVTIYDEDADEFYGVKEILVQEGDDVLEDGHPYLVLNKDSGDLDSQVFYRDFQTGYDAESFGATSQYYKTYRLNDSISIYDEDDDEFYGIKDIRISHPDDDVADVIGEDSIYLVLNNGSDTDSSKTYEDIIGGAESFEAQGNPDKRTTTQYANFYVGWEDEEGELRGGGKFKKFNDAKAQAEIVAKRNGNSRVVEKRGFALWTDDGKGMWQEGYDKTDAKKFYSAEGYSIGSGFRLGFGLGLGMLALSTVTTIVALAASTIDERQVE